MSSQSHNFKSSWVNLTWWRWHHKGLHTMVTVAIKMSQFKGTLKLDSSRTGFNRWPHGHPSAPSSPNPPGSPSEGADCHQRLCHSHASLGGTLLRWQNGSAHCGVGFVISQDGRCRGWLWGGYKSSQHPQPFIHCSSSHPCSKQGKRRHWCP